MLANKQFSRLRKFSTIFATNYLWGNTIFPHITLFLEMPWNSNDTGRRTYCLHGNKMAAIQHPSHRLVRLSRQNCLPSPSERQRKHDNYMTRTTRSVIIIWSKGWMAMFPRYMFPLGLGYMSPQVYIPHFLYAPCSPFNNKIRHTPGGYSPGGT